MRFLLRGLVVLAALTLGGCLIESDKLPGDPRAPVDARLAGAWYQKSGNEMNLFVFGRTTVDGGEVAIVDWVVVTMRVPQKVERIRYRYWTTWIGAWRIASVEAMAPFHKGMPRRTVVAYRLAPGDRLLIALPNARFVREAVKEGDIAGVVERNVVRLTADAPALSAFIARHGAQIFKFRDVEAMRRLPATERRP